MYNVFKCAVRSDTDKACSIHCIAFVLVLLSLYRLGGEKLLELETF